MSVQEAALFSLQLQAADASSSSVIWGLTNVRQWLKCALIHLPTTYNRVTHICYVSRTTNCFHLLFVMSVQDIVQTRNTDSAR